MNKLSKFALLATSVAALCAHTASAAPYTAGDLIISFRATGANGNADQTYSLNVGAATGFRDATTNSVVTNIAADLATAFGANWATRTDIYWGIIANNTNAPSGGVVNGDPVRTIYASNDQTTVGTQSSVAAIPTSATRGTVSTQVQTFVAAFAAAASNGVNPNGAIIPVSSTNDYSEFGLNSAQDFGSTFGGDGIEGNSASGVVNTALDLYRILNNNTGANPTGTVGTGSYEGTFTIAANGDVSFRTTPAFVPEEPIGAEPLSTGILTSFVFAGLAGLARRKNAAQA